MSHVSVQLCGPRDLSPMAQTHIDTKKFPLEIKRLVLLSKIDVSKIDGMDKNKAQANYDDYMRLYNRRMQKRSA